MESSKKEAFLLITRLSVAAAFSYYTVKWMSQFLDPTAKQKQQSTKKVSVSISYCPLICSGC